MELLKPCSLPCLVEVLGPAFGRQESLERQQKGKMLDVVNASSKSGVRTGCMRS